jgi:hypothetical protein
LPETDFSIAKMTSPCGWVEPGQAPEFEDQIVARAATSEEL